MFLIFIITNYQLIYVESGKLVNKTKIRAFISLLFAKTF